jgi:hypothetical protein
LLAGTVGTWFAVHNADSVTNDGIHDLKVVTDLKKETQNQMAKSQEQLKQQEQKLGKTTSDMLKQNHQGGHLEGFGAALGKFVVDALSQKTEEVRKALEEKAPRKDTQAEKERQAKIMEAYELKRSNEEREQYMRGLEYLEQQERDYPILNPGNISRQIRQNIWENDQRLLQTKKEDVRNALKAKPPGKK